MLRIALAGTCALAALSISFADEPAAGELLGTWTIEEVESDGQDISDNVPSGAQLIFEKEGKWSFRAGEAKIDGTYEADSTTDPKLLDLTLKTPDSGEEQMVEGIYRIEEKMLRICVQTPGQTVKQRPIKFAGDAGAGTILFILKKAG